MNYTKLNTEQMDENQRLLMDARGSELQVMTDTVYNNPPKGRSMYQAGTQSHTPMIDAETGLVLAQQTFIKLENMPTWRRQLPLTAQPVKASVQNIEKSGLKVTHVISDGCAKIKTAPEQLRCTVQVRLTLSEKKMLRYILQ